MCMTFPSFPFWGSIMITNTHMYSVLPSFTLAIEDLDKPYIATAGAE